MQAEQEEAEGGEPAAPPRRGSGRRAAGRQDTSARMEDELDDAMQADLGGGAGARPANSEGATR